MGDSFDGAKWALFEALLPLCPYVEVYTRHPDCVIPEPVLGVDRIIFRLGRDPAIICVPDLAMDARGWGGTLSFRGSLHYAYVPWQAVLAIRCTGPNGAAMESNFQYVVAAEDVPEPPKRAGKRPSALRSKSPFTVIRGGLDE